MRMKAGCNPSESLKTMLFIWVKNQFPKQQKQQALFFFNFDKQK